MKKLILLPFILAFAAAPHTFEDAVIEMSPGRRGAGEMLLLVRTLGRAVSSHKADARSKRLLEFADRSLSDFNFGDFYENRALVPLDDGFRGAIFAGNDDGRFLQIRCVTKDHRHDWSRFGNFTAEFGLKKNPRGSKRGDTYSGRIEIFTALKDLSYRNLNAFVKGLLRVIDPDNIGRLPVPPSGGESALNDESLRVLEAYRRAFPSFTAMMLRYFSINSLVAVKGAGAGRHTALQLRFSFNMDGIARDYPAAAGYLKGMTGLFKFQGGVRNDRGHKVFDFAIDSNDVFFTADMLTRRGMIVPSGEGGGPLFGEEFDLATGGPYDFTARSDFFTNVYGLKFTTEGIRSRHGLGENGPTGFFRNRLLGVPPTRIAGRAFHLFPPWLIDLAIPDNMEELIGEFTRVMVNANGGAGSIMDFEWDLSRPGGTRFRYLAASEFVDNFFVRFGLRIWKRRVIPGGDAASDFKSGVMRALGALEDDLRGIAGR